MAQAAKNLATMRLEELIEQYPEFFAEKNCGFHCGDGWVDLIECLLDEVKNWNIYHSPFEFQIVQIKEKFGELRVYHNGAPEKIEGFIDAIEYISARTCEYCGDKGHPRNGSWIKTLCDKCVDKRKS